MNGPARRAYTYGSKGSSQLDVGGYAPRCSGGYEFSRYRKPPRSVRAAAVGVRRRPGQGSGLLAHFQRPEGDKPWN